MRISEECDEIVGITGRVIEGSVDLFIPTCIEFKLLACNEDYPVNLVFQGLCGVYDEVRIESDRGISYDDLEDAMVRSAPRRRRRGASGASR